MRTPRPLRHLSPTCLLVLLTAAVSPAHGAEQSPSVPDLSGFWRRDMLFLEQPASGSGPILNRARRPDGTMDFLQWVGDHTNPLLKPHAAEVVRQRGELASAGMPPPDPNNQCRPSPTPYILGIQFVVQMLQQKDKVILLYEADHKVRHVPLNVPHPPNLSPTWQGNSVGRCGGLLTHSSYTTRRDTTH